ncbi:peptide deformylase [Intestinibacter bartlettii DSM 16795]|jgi:peptide deformylase|nr:peptide deformylase [Intestinibacter bartlettii DSM 16795]
MIELQFLGGNKMALRQIVKIGEPVLRKKSKVVKEINDRIIELLDDMADTMYEADGVGLAAPQVGILKRVVVIDIGDGLIELINPEIIETEGEYLDNEGCLSVPGECGDVLRPYRVKVRAQNRFGETVEIEGEELLARAFCHEIDHLDGILYVDKVIK